MAWECLINAGITVMIVFKTAVSPCPRYYIFFDVRLQFYGRTPYWIVLKKGIWKNAQRIEIESAPWSTPTRFFLKLLLY